TNNGLNRLANGRFTAITVKDGLTDNNIQALMVDRGGNTWVGTLKGFSRVEAKPTKIISYTTADGLPHNFVRSIFEDRAGHIWIGTDSGLSLFSGETFRNFYSGHGLRSDKIYDIFQDNEGNIWLGTGLGVSMLHSLRFSNFSIRDGLADNLVWSIREEKPGTYWIGTDKGVSRYSNGHFKTYTTADGLAGNSVYYMIKTRDGAVWFATDGGLSVFRGNTFTNYTTGDGLPHRLVLTLEEDRNGTIWVGTVRGLCRFMDGKIVPSPVQPEPYPIHTIMEDKEGNIWFSQFEGVRKISANGGGEHYSTGSGLVYDTVKSLFQDSRGRIWFGTQQGLSSFWDGKFTNYTTSDGLSDDDCYFTLEDDSGNLWVGTGKGVDRFDGKTFRNYSSKDGLPSTEMSQSACFKDSSGNLWFGANGGVSRFNPRLDRVNNVPPPVYMTTFKVMGEDYPVSGGPRLKYNRNYIEIGFAATSFSSPGDVTYKYRLKGSDASWFETGNRLISYPSLNPGNYTFQVIARNEEGIESTEAAELSFRILPPFWQTWWFRLAAVAFLLFIILMMVLWQFKRVKQRMALEARNKQLEMAQRMELMGFLAGGAVHDLKNLLSIIIGYSKMLSVEYAGKAEGDAEGDKNREALDVIKSSATTAVQVVKQVLAFARQSYDGTTAVDLTQMMTELLEILTITMPPEIKIEWNPGPEGVFFHMDPVKFKQLAMNLCINAVHAMPEGGELDISLLYGPADTVILEVSDTGPGIEKDIIERIFDPLFTTKKPGEGTGLGLFVVQRIIAENKGTIHVDSKPGEGTIFRVSFPHSPRDSS
ncbi:MAG: hypothetical protein GY940_39930, partial [bacterium]|nr:hypothetical protein [bacterium]